MTPQEKELLKLMASTYNELKNAFTTGDRKAADQALLRFDLNFGFAVAEAHGTHWQYRPVYGHFLQKGHVYALVKLDGPNGPLFAFRDYYDPAKAKSDSRNGKILKMFRIPGDHSEGDVPF